MNQVATTKDNALKNDYGISMEGMPLGLAVMFNDRLYDRCKDLAFVMAKADGVTPAHLMGKPEACFAVLTRAITWKLDPQAVSHSTYQTPGGRIGYEGKLVQAILENSGQLVGGVQYELIGNWDKINGNFEIKKSDKGKDYPVPRWTRAEAKAGECGVVISCQVRGEKERRTLKFMLETCFPLNSTLWATRPDQQIKYTGCRAFANTVAPGIMMGVPFSSDREAGIVADAEPKDITPSRPTVSGFSSFDQAENVDPVTGEVTSTTNEDEASSDVELGPPEAMEQGVRDRDAGKPLLMVPDLWRDVESMAEAWRHGWKSRDEELRKAAKT